MLLIRRNLTKGEWLDESKLYTFKGIDQQDQKCEDPEPINEISDSLASSITEHLPNFDSSFHLKRASIPRGCLRGKSNREIMIFYAENKLL
jgi:hypothetical protein